MALTRLTIQDFIKELASDSPAPGGGSIAALCGALGAALAAMVAGLTIGKEKYKAAWEDLERVSDQATPLSQRFLDLVQRDTDAYNAVFAAFRLPKTTDAERKSREEAIQATMKLAAGVPLETLQASIDLIQLALTAIKHGNPNAITDAGAAAQMARSAAAIAAYNVQINLPGIKDADFVVASKQAVEGALRSADILCAEAHETVNAHLN